MLLASTVNDDGVGTYGRTLLILSTPDISSFKISTTAFDLFGVNEIQLNNPILKPPVGGEIVPSNINIAAIPLVAVLIAAVMLNIGVIYRKKRRYRYN